MYFFILNIEQILAGWVFKDVGVPDTVIVLITLAL